ncbi:hypothetical protein PG990_007527 [Apiospora arundinis]
MSGSTASEGASQSNSDTIGSLLARENSEVLTNAVDWENFTYEEYTKHKGFLQLLSTDLLIPGSDFQGKFPRPRFSQVDRLFRHEDGFEHQILSRDIIPSVNHALKRLALLMDKSEEEVFHIGRAGRSDDNQPNARKRPDWVVGRKVGDKCNPRSLGAIFSRFSRLQEIHYEPWREWDRYEQKATDRGYESLLESVASANPQVRRITLFENFNNLYADTLITGYPRSEAFQCDTSRILSAAAGRLVAQASLELEHLSASFMVDAGSFFAASHRNSSWTWPRLQTLIPTTQVFGPGVDALRPTAKILERAATAARKMPRLETLHIWNGREPLAASFRYQASPPSITWRGTWPHTLRHDVIYPWKEVAYDRDPDTQLAVYREAIDKRFVMKSHADAVHYLNLPATVIRPVSLQKIRLGDIVRAERRVVERQCMLNLITSGSNSEFDTAVPMLWRLDLGIYLS